MQRFPHGATLRPPFARPGAGYGRRIGRPGPESARPKPVQEQPAARALNRIADERGTSVT